MQSDKSTYVFPDVFALFHDFVTLVGLFNAEVILFSSYPMVNYNGIIKIIYKQL